MSSKIDDERGTYEEHLVFMTTHHTISNHLFACFDFWLSKKYCFSFCFPDKIIYFLLIFQKAQTFVVQILFTDWTIAEESFSQSFNALSSVRAFPFSCVAHRNVDLAVSTWEKRGLWLRFKSENFKRAKINQFLNSVSHKNCLKFQISKNKNINQYAIVPLVKSNGCRDPRVGIQSIGKVGGWSTFRSTGPNFRQKSLKGPKVTSKKIWWTKINCF